MRKGVVTLLRPEMRNPGVQFHVRAGERSYGNYLDRDLLAKLLED